MRQSLIKTGGSKQIDLSKYDDFFLVGLGVNLRTLGRMLHNIHSQISDAEHKPTVSNAILAAAHIHKLKQTTANHIIDLIRSEIQAPIRLIPEPLYAPDLIDDPDLPFLKTIHSLNMNKFTYSLFITNIMKTFGDKIEVMTQPDETREREIFTKAIFSRDKEGDRAHKNEAYGKIVMERFFEMHDPRAFLTPADESAPSPNLVPLFAGGQSSA